MVSNEFALDKSAGEIVLRRKLFTVYRRTVVDPEMVLKMTVRLVSSMK